MARTKAADLATWGGSNTDPTTSEHPFFIEGLFNGRPGTNPAPFVDAPFPIVRERSNILRMNRAPGTFHANYIYAWLYKLQPNGSANYVGPGGTDPLVGNMADKNLLSQRANSAAISYRVKNPADAQPIAISAIDIYNGVYDSVLDGYAEQWYAMWQLNTSLTHHCEIQSEANVGDSVYDPNPNDQAGQPETLEPWEPHGARAFAYIVERWENWNGGALPMHDKIKICLSLTAGQFPGAFGGENADHFFEPTGGPALWDYLDTVGADMYIHDRVNEQDKHFAEEFQWGYDYAVANGKEYCIPEFSCEEFAGDPMRKANEYTSILQFCKDNPETSFVMLTYGNNHHYFTSSNAQTAITALVNDPYWGSDLTVVPSLGQRDHRGGIFSGGR